MLTIEQIKNTKTAITHNGPFHADDVFSAALLKIINPDIAFIRTRNIPENFNGIVFDVGGGEYDHHQKDNEVRENGIPYAAFGKICRDVLPQMFSKKDIDEFEKNIVEKLDATDNGYGKQKSELSQLISNFNPTWNSTQSQDEAFENAVNIIAKPLLEKQFESFKARELAQDLVINSFNNSNKTTVVLDKFMPWDQILVDTSAKMVIFPARDGQFNLQLVPKEIGSFDTKIKVPEEWLGFRKTDDNDSPVPGMTFCHASGFLSAFNSQEAAINASNLIMAKEFAKEINATISKINSKHDNIDNKINNTSKTENNKDINIIVKSEEII